MSLNYSVSGSHVCRLIITINKQTTCMVRKCNVCSRSRAIILNVILNITYWMKADLKLLFKMSRNQHEINRSKCVHNHLHIDNHFFLYFLQCRYTLNNKCVILQQRKCVKYYISERWTTGILIFYCSPS